MSKKQQKNAFFMENIWSIQKKAVPLHPLSEKKYIPTGHRKRLIASLAQLVEHVICNLEVVGSSPTRGS